jgi:hypothetical protein
MGAAARRWVVERFDWALLARQAEQVFRGGSPALGSCPPVEPVWQ